MEFIAKTFFGLEPILAKEIKSFGGTDIQILKRAVSFQGGLEQLYRLNYEGRTVLRVLRPIYKFQARSERILYHKISSYNWGMHFSQGQTFAIDSTVTSKLFRHSKYVALKTKDAIVDQFRKKTGDRPSVDTRNPDIRLNVHCFEDNFTISLDASGSSLHRRGYREGQTHGAPLNEVLAAGLLKVSKWHKSQPLQDGMCGSGTILLEAAMVATKMPPGYLRKGKYGFEKWKDFDASLLEKIRTEAFERMDLETKMRIAGSDMSKEAIASAKHALEFLELEDAVQLEVKPFEECSAAFEGGLLIMNPPYGERLEPDDINALYKSIGDGMKQRFPGKTAWLISSNRQALKHIGLRAEKKVVMYNGPLECRFQKYTLYEGTRRRDFNPALAKH